MIEFVNTLKFTLDNISKIDHILSDDQNTAGQLIMRFPSTQGAFTLIKGDSSQNEDVALIIKGLKMIFACCHSLMEQIHMSHH